MDILHSFSELGDWSDRPVVFTVGFFDGVHRGHQALVRTLTDTAREYAADSLLITFANSPRGFHQPDRRFPYLTMPEEKLHLLKGLGIDATLMLDYDAGVAANTAAEFIGLINAQAPVKALVIGYDSRFGCDMVGGLAGFTELTEKLGLGLRFVEAVTYDDRPVKSRETRELTRRGRMADVRSVLGHPYFAIGTVRHGKGKGGRELSIPTANLVMPPQKLCPPVGIYAGVAEVAGRRYPAAMCVMTAEVHVRTALENGGESLIAPLEPMDTTVIEAHLLDFTGSLYGQVIKVDFIKHLRGWVDFASPAELLTRIERDIAETRAVVSAEPGLLEV